MEITFIGAIVIILSIIAFFKKDDWLLYIAVASSLFTAAMAIDIKPTMSVILPYQIPALIWMIKQIIIFFKNGPKLTFFLIKDTFKTNKIFRSLVIFSVCLVLSTLFMAVTRAKISYIDIDGNQQMISFIKANVTQVLYVLFILAFAGILSLKISTKEEVKKILKVIIYTTIFAIIWGLIQFIIKYFGITYTAFLFNNNRYAAQMCNDTIRDIQRITSIGTEPSVFALNLLGVIPIIVIAWFDKPCKKYFVILLLSLVCALLTLSSTAFIGLGIMDLVIAIYLLFNKKIKNRINKLLKYCGVFALSVVISVAMIILSLSFEKKFINKDKPIIDNIPQVPDNNVPEVIEPEIPDNNVPEVIEPEIPDNNVPEVIEPEVPDNNVPEVIEPEVPDNNVPEVVEPEVPDNNIPEVVIPDISDSEIIKESTKSFWTTIFELTINKLNTGSGIERLKIERIGLNVFVKSPIFGVGLGSFRTFTLPVNILTNLGLIGLLSYIYTLVISLKLLYVNRKFDKKMCLMFIFSIIFMNIAFFVSVPDLIYLYYWVILVLGYKYATIIEHKEK